MTDVDEEDVAVMESLLRSGEHLIEGFGRTALLSALAQRRELLAEAESHGRNSAAFQDDLQAALRLVVGHDWPADPRSPHNVFLDELLPRIEKLLARVAELDEMRVAALAYAERVRDVTESEKFRGPFILAHVHGQPYGGPFLPEPGVRDELIARLSRATSAPSAPGAEGGAR